MLIYDKLMWPNDDDEQVSQLVLTLFIADQCCKQQIKTMCCKKELGQQILYMKNLPNEKK